MMPKGHLVQPLIERFEAKVEPVTESGCWIWTAALGATGYGRFHLGVRGRPIEAHRAAWEIYRGPIPRDGLVLHKCDVRACVNPAHLYIGNKSDNITDWRTRHGRN
jgi:hypothetical protein